MAGQIDFNHEFEFFDSSDDGSPLPALNFEADIASPQPSNVHLSRDKGLDTTLHPGNDGLSPKSSEASTAESSSSKRTGGTSSTKTSFSGGADVPMTDRPSFKPVWKPEDFVNDEEDRMFTMFDGTVNPSAIENTFDFMDGQVHDQYVFESASTSPGPFAATATDIASPSAASSAAQHSAQPVASSAASMQSPDASFSPIDLTSSMNGLNTTASRDVSPGANFVVSQQPSPSALFQAPSPAAAYPGMPVSGFATSGTSWPSQSRANPASQNAVAPPPFLMNTSVPGFPVGYSYSQQRSRTGPPTLSIHPTPLKSRVETQIPIKMTLSALPPGIRHLHLPRHTISKPKLLAKPRAERTPDMLELRTTLVCTSAMQDPEQREAALQRARQAAANWRTMPQSGDQENQDDLKPQDGGDVHICVGCVTRERKRAARKKIKKVDDEEIWKLDEEKRVIVFNTQEMKEWQPVNPQMVHPDQSLVGTPVHIDAPMRIACYCRHHSEKLGFQVIFTITDFQGNFVAQAMSTSIMITDDHKTHTLPTEVTNGSANKSESSLIPPLTTVNPALRKSLSPEGPFRLSHSSSDLPALMQSSAAGLPRATSSLNASQANSVAPTPRNLSRPASPTSASAPSAKKRKASGSTKVPSGLAMTRLETTTARTSPQPTQPAQMATAPASASVSPFTANLSMTAIGQDALFGVAPTTPATMMQPFSAAPLTPNSNDQAMFGSTARSTSFENLAQAQIYSAPASSHASRAPSPNGLRNSAAAMQQQANFAQALQNSLYTLPMAMPAPSTRPQAPLIHKIIPAEGPKCGGIEVTVLGGAFYQGLEVMFGDIKATTTTFWGESSLVCLLPPSPTAGNVIVSFKQHPPTPQQAFMSKPQQPVFKYLDDDEQQLMRTALTVLAHKMTGSFEDVADVARRIIGEADSGFGGGSSGGMSIQRGSGGGFTSFGLGTSQSVLETQLLKVLDLLDVDDSTRRAKLNLRRAATGQTMMHLACSLGLKRFVAGLLARGAYCDLRDHCGYTALHLAALNDHEDIVRRLIYAGADPTIRSLSGLTAADVARSREVIKSIRRVERQARSRSGGSLHSRVNSANSLRSLWEPLATSHLPRSSSAAQLLAGEESPEYTSEDFDLGEEEDDDDGPWIEPRRSAHNSRRSTRHNSFVESSDTADDDGDDADVETPPAALSVGSVTPTGPASRAAAMSALKNQFATQLQHIQHAMAMQMQNISQLPYMPQMPNFSGIAPLPDYQAYLYSAPVVQRLTSLMPSIGGSRPGSAGDLPPSKEMDGRWWDLSSLMPSAAPPPAYDELFPQDQLDIKQTSAAQAAAEAEADSKCATLFDQVASTSTAAAAVAQPQLPSLLQIGRKNAITKEQQDNLRRAHAEKVKRISRDRNLFFIWIPLLIIVMCAMLYNRFPMLLSIMTSIVHPVVKRTQVLRTGAPVDRIVEVV